MTSSKATRRRLAASTVWLTTLLMAPLAEAQETGTIFGTVSETSGAHLPGATITLTGFGATRYQVSDSNGGFRFLGLDPGAWSVEARLDGFSTVTFPDVVVSINRNSEIVLTLSHAVEETLTVTAESPLLDERKITSGTTVSQIELEKIPSARDPWAVMTQSAGVLLDRVNVGGTESGLDPEVVGAGTSQNQNAYYLDGGEITGRNVGAEGWPTTIFDFDQFAEMQFQTGGSDVSRDVPGVTINLVTKRGSNEFRGSGRFFLTDQQGYFGALRQGSIDIDPDDFGAGQDPESFMPTQVDRIQEYGFEAGGPLWRDHLWSWGAWSTNDISRIGTTERDLLEFAAIKLNAQFSPANSAVTSFNSNQRNRVGVGVAPNRAPDSLWNIDAPAEFFKFEDSHLFGSNLYVSGQYLNADAGSGLVSTGGCGPDGQEMFVGADGIRHGSICGLENYPSQELRLDASWFTTAGTLSHEVKFGGRLRDFETTGDWSYPGRDILNYHGAYVGVQIPFFLELFGLPESRLGDLHLAYAYRQGPVSSSIPYRGLWVQDTITWNRWTVNAGLRWDDADGANEPGVVPANPAFPEVMPKIVFEGNNGDGLHWSAIQPRVGVTYALGEERKTLLRGSLGRFADPLSLSMISRVSPLEGQYAGILFVDEPDLREGIYDESEAFAVIGGFFGYDPANPTAVENTNRNDPSMDPPLTDELILGIEHAFLPELVVGLQYTWRKGRDIADLRELFVNPAGEIQTVGAPEYIDADPISFSFPGDDRVFSYTPQRVAPGFTNTGGTQFTNGDRTTTYNALTLNVTKRLSNRWMMRGYVQWGQPEWTIPSVYFADNDTNTLLPSERIGETIASNASVDGALKLEEGEVFIQASWVYNVNGMYQVAPERPWGFNIAANIYGREGYPIPYFVFANPGDGIQRLISANEVAFGDIDAFRADDLLIIDFRIEKEFAASGNTSLTFSIDGFNLLNEASVVARESRNLDAPNAGWLAETLGPRIWRLGVRLSWR